MLPIGAVIYAATRACGGYKTDAELDKATKQTGFTDTDVAVLIIVGIVAVVIAFVVFPELCFIVGGGCLGWMVMSALTRDCNCKCSHD
jgi:hypothetical protein